MTEQITLITGATRGIGKAIATGLAREGFALALVSRDPVRGQVARSEIVAATGNDAIDVLEADLASQASIRRLADEVRERYPRLDVLINNAGVAKREYTLTPDGLETTFAVNHLAPFLLTNLLLDLLRASAPARALATSSMVHRWGRIDFEDLQGERDYDMDRAYNQSKLANVLFTRELSRRLEGSGVTANSFEPGMTATDFGREYLGFKAFMIRAWRPFMRTPERAAETAMYLATSPEVAGVSGQHFVNGRAVRSSRASYGRELARRLWSESERLTGITTEAPEGVLS